MGTDAAALRLGIIGLVQFVPLFLLTLVTGWTADRVDRRWIARSFGLSGASLRAGAGGARRTHATTLLSLYVIAALLGVARAFAGPALGALAPNLVPREILPAPSRSRQSPGKPAPSAARRSAATSTRLRRSRLTRPARFCSSLHSSACSRSRRCPSQTWTAPATLGAKWSRGFATSATIAWCWARSASTCLRSCWAGRRPCCQSSRAMCFTPGRKVSATSAPRRLSAPR